MSIPILSSRFDFLLCKKTICVANNSKLKRLLFERVDKVDDALEGQTQSLRQSLVLRFSPDTPFSTKTSSASGFAVAHR